jgi:YVTN family beta-propeller protein
VVTSATNDIWVIATASNTVVATVPVGSSPVAFGQFIDQNQAPLLRKQCRKDGWQDFPQFNNQGECISFVKHQRHPR